MQEIKRRINNTVKSTKTIQNETTTGTKTIMMVFSKNPDVNVWYHAPIIMTKMVVCLQNLEYPNI